jgi:phosphoribosylaminoimidazole-succinocarboxamide synthase
MENGFQGKEGQSVPEMTDEVINGISARYMELYEAVIGEKFVPQPLTEQELQDGLVVALAKL